MPIVSARGEETDSHRRGVSRVGDVHFVLAISGIFEASAYVLFREIGKFRRISGWLIPLARYSGTS
jgi:hypothetical protein